MFLMHGSPQIRTFQPMQPPVHPVPQTELKTNPIQLHQHRSCEEVGHTRFTSLTTPTQIWFTVTWICGVNYIYNPHTQIWFTVTWICGMNYIYNPHTQIQFAVTCGMNYIYNRKLIKLKMKAKLIIIREIRH